MSDATSEPGAIDPAAPPADAPDVLGDSDSDAFLGEIRAFPYTYAPRGWATCDGQLLTISTHTALFALLGVAYGGNGSSTFGLPNLAGCAPLFWGQGSGLSTYDWGETGGTPEVTLLGLQMPQHTHSFNISNTQGNERQPPGQLYAQGDGVAVFGSAGPPQTQLWPRVVEYAGNSAPHNNMMPFLMLRFCIALEGEYPKPG